MIESPSLRLKTALNSLVPIRARYGPLWTDPRLRTLYPRYLITLHSVIRASVPLMTIGRDVARQRSADSEANSGLAAYLDRHIPEEMHHDEWLLNDLEIIGVSREEVTSHVPTPTIAALVGAQYYYVNDYRPVALLGYIARLEAYPPTKDQIQNAIRLTGYPEAAFGCLLTHADDDPYHSDELYQVIDSLPLDEHDMTAITTNAMATAERCSLMIGEIVTQNPMTLLQRDQEQARRTS